MSDPLPAPSFNIPYSVPPTNIGEGYAAGITQAGKSLSEAIGAVSSIYTQNRNADDMLSAMHQNKMITPDEYESVAGKSLGAKQQLLGMYATQWANQQAQQFALTKQRASGAVEIGVEHAKLLDTMNMLRQGYGDTKKLLYTGQPQQTQQPAGQVGQQITAPAPWKPGTKAVQVKDTQTGNMITAFQTPDGTLHDQQGNVLQ